MSQIRRRNLRQNNNVEVVDVPYPNTYSGYYTITSADNRSVLYTANNSIVVIKDGVVLDSSQYTTQNNALMLNDVGLYEVHYFVKNVSWAYATSTRKHYNRITVPKVQYMAQSTDQIGSIINSSGHVNIIELLEENPALYKTKNFVWNERAINIPDIIRIPIGSKAAYMTDERFAPYADRFVEVKYNFINE